MNIMQSCGRADNNRELEESEPKVLKYKGFEERDKVNKRFKRS